MRLQIICIFILTTFFASHINAQSFIAISTGLSKDLNNKPPFYMVPVTLRWEPFKRSAFFIEATKENGFNKLSKADAYTANAQLPEHVALTEALSTKSFSVGIGGAVVLYTTKKNNRFTLNTSVGICTEHFSVNYRNYDKVNYEVLNPDVNEYLEGLYVSIAAVYNFHKTKQDMFLMLELQSPSSARKPDHYYLWYNKTAPMQLTFGYKLFYNKKK